MNFKILSWILLLVAFTGCSEGDIITEEIDFTADLENCANGNDFVFYKVDTAINQAISLSFTSSSFELLPETAPTDTTSITLNGTTNVLIYREFSSPIDGTTYFCASIPPSDNNITNELVASDGTVEIFYELQEGTDPPVYTRTVLLRDVTLIGDGIAIRREFLTLGSEDIAFIN